MRAIRTTLARILILGFVTAFLHCAQADWMVNTLTLLDGSNGKWCEGGVVKGPDGYLYATSANGGTNGGFGTIFRVSTNGDGATAIFHFSGTNGAYPTATLAVGDDGCLYGSTLSGGNGFDGRFYSGMGTLFRISTNGDFTSLFQFDGTNGLNPYAPLTRGTDGVFYGTTSGNYWGLYTNSNCRYGTIFQLFTNGAFAHLLTFSSSNGAAPTKLTELGSGFIGATSLGGVSNLGTVFTFSTDGGLNTVVSFVGTNGGRPTAGIVLGADGRLYGTTQIGPSGSWGDGIVYRVSTNGELTILHEFNYNDGHYIDGLLTCGPDGALYGTTAVGGKPSTLPQAMGTIYRITTNGEFASMLVFNGIRGFEPIAGLTADVDGSFYGTTSGAGGWFGTVFRIAPIANPLMQDVKIVNWGDEELLTFKWGALGGVQYVLEWNSTFDSQGWTQFGNIAWENTNRVLSSEANFVSPMWINPGENRFFRLRVWQP